MVTRRREVPMLLRPRNLILATAAAGTAVTLLFALSPGLQVAYRDPALHAALEATAALVTMLAAYLVFGRFRARGSLDDLVLVCGLALLAASDLCFAAVPAAIAVDYNGVFSTWAVVAGRLAGAVAFAAAGFVPARRLRDPHRAAAAALTLCAAFLGALAVAAAALAPRLPRGLNPQDFRSIGLPPLHASPAISAVQLVSVTIFALAAFGFARLAEREHDGFMRWLAVGATVAAFSRVNYFLYPSLYTQWVYVGDCFRLLFCLILLMGSLNEIGQYWKRLAQAAVLEERRRLARDLHDGVAQEIAYISRNATLLGENRSGGGGRGGRAARRHRAAGRAARARGRARRRARAGAARGARARRLRGRDECRAPQRRDDRAREARARPP